MTERWLPVVGFEGAYQVSSEGKVRSTRKGGGIIAQVRRGRYLAYSLRAAPKKALWSAHVIVAEAFIGPRMERMQVAHLDGNPLNNSVSNLAYVTQRENEFHKRAHGTSREQAAEEKAAIIREIMAAGIPQERVARLLNTSVGTVSRMVARYDSAGRRHRTGDSA